MKHLNKPKVSYQGMPGAFSDIAIKKYFKKKAVALPKQTFKELFESVNNKDCDFAMVPVENSIAGKVGQNYNLIEKYGFITTGEINLRIQHQLLAIHLKNVSKVKRLKMIKKVYSHPVALAQCKKFFNNHPWMQAVNHQDTAGSAKDLADLKNKDTAAIASIEAAKIYKLEVLKKNIESSKNNFTRFVIIALRFNKH